MAKGRKSSKVKKIIGREERMLQALWKTGQCTREQLERIYGIKINRVEKLIKSGYLKQNKSVIQLNTEGVKYCKKTLGLQYQYKPNVSHIRHDIKFFEAYNRLDKDMQDMLKTENEIRSMMKNNSEWQSFIHEKQIEYNGNFKGVPDAVIFNPKNGNMIAFEITTRNYTEQHKQMKTDFANAFCNGNIVMV